MKLMGHARALLMENPELDLDALEKKIRPHFPNVSPAWLRHNIGRYRKTIRKQARTRCLRCKGAGFEP